MPADTPLAALESIAQSLTERAYVPYSRHPQAAALLLSDGLWIPGVRVENASFPLSIPALLNGFTTAAALQRTDVVAVVQSDPFTAVEQAYLTMAAPALVAVQGTQFRALTHLAQLPTPQAPLSPFCASPAPESEAQGISLAREIAQHAVIPASNFPVGTALQVADGKLVPGVNVEIADWLHILCAERNALGTAVSYGLSRAETLFLSCPQDATASPCGACRQVLLELAPNSRIWMDRGEAAPQMTQPGDLLPGAFTGASLHT